jgi:transcriptional regulator NrdR family protein
VATDVIKRGGERPTERFVPDKLHASVRAACLSVRSPEGEAEMTAASVCHAVEAWLSTRLEVTSADLRRKATETLEAHHPEAAYLYKHHRLII